MDDEPKELMKINKRFIAYVVVLLVLAWHSVDAATDDTAIPPIRKLENTTAIGSGIYDIQT